MRLINTSTFRLKEYVGDEIPRYAILSHRWENEEVIFPDMRNLQYDNGKQGCQKKNRAMRREGWSKIEGCCKQAASDGYQWVWIDSCCIDKSSSAELSEVINSMFEWYKRAGICYVYLSDVLSGGGWEGRRCEESVFRASKWFVRGWTLQELLAPTSLVFFNHDWEEIGTRSKLWPIVSAITGIANELSWNNSSIAQKMSWASGRKTTRIEDRAYSLMGLLGVNMPPLYGEGEKAFLRLQLEVLKISNDETIFAWRDNQNVDGGVLAHSPDAFQESGNIVPSVYPSWYSGEDCIPYSMTNKGLNIELWVIPAAQAEMAIKEADHVFIAPLNCESSYGAVALILTRTEGDRFERVSSGELMRFSLNCIRDLNNLEKDSLVRGQKKAIYIGGPGGAVPEVALSYKTILISKNLLLLAGFCISARYPSSRFRWQVTDQEERITIVYDEMEGETVALEFTREYAARSERVLLILNSCANRVRLGVLIPKDGISMTNIVKDMFRPGDWMAKHDFPLPKLESGHQITTQLHKDDFKSTVYKAEISLTEVRKGAPAKQVLGQAPWRRLE